MDISTTSTISAARLNLMPQPGRAPAAQHAAPHAARPAQGLQPARENPRAWAVAQDFEAMFITTMLESMGQDVQNGDGLFGGGHGEAMFRSLLNDEYGKHIAARGGIGIADSIYRFILRTQEV